MRRWALVAKLTKSLECKHEQLVTWRSSVYQSREVESEQSDRFSRNCTSSKESRRIRRSVGCHVVSHKCHFGTDTNTHNRFQTPPLFVTVSRIPLSLTDPTVCNFCTIPPTSENLGSSPLRPEVKFDKFTRSGAERSYKNLSIKDRMPMVVPPQRTQFRRDSWTKNVLAFIHDGCWERTRVNLLMKCWQKGRFWR